MNSPEKAPDSSEAFSHYKAYMQARGSPPLDEIAFNQRWQECDVETRAHALHRFITPPEQLLTEGTEKVKKAIQELSNLQ